MHLCSHLPPTRASLRTSRFRLALNCQFVTTLRRAVPQFRFAVHPQSPRQQRVHIDVRLHTDVAGITRCVPDVRTPVSNVGHCVPLVRSNVADVSIPITTTHAGPPIDDPTVRTPALFALGAFQRLTGSREAPRVRSAPP
jgi:hypothetical protein